MAAVIVIWTAIVAWFWYNEGKAVGEINKEEYHQGKCEECCENTKTQV